MKRYNDQTGCYKIDIYVDGAYFCSTDQSKTLKAAKVRFLAKYDFPEKSVKCKFEND